MSSTVYDTNDLRRYFFGGINKYNFIFKMAGDFVPESELNLKGWQKHFNSYTLRGRFNWVAATYGSLFGGFILYKLLKKKPQLTDH
ncbi:ATP synthase membrane subunit K, mitochondrial-like isoform X1 [Physella acuta]|uniref:ATP synthase membrane subunit K, mitochondrial-like isoform X1 n=1 Tax=Physella acuta TaxID=109671 RepID=UPI0027DB1539|nr:ATP synthase membrane subunit K, mitochondrial-like isoform X1 [Physella acuta]